MSEPAKISSLNMRRITRQSSQSSNAECEVATSPERRSTRNVSNNEQIRRRNREKDILLERILNDSCTPESLDSTSLSILREEENYENSGDDSDASHSYISSQSCLSSGYPLLTNSRSPSPRTIPRTPQVDRSGYHERFEDRKISCFDYPVSRNGSIEDSSPNVSKRKKKTSFYQTLSKSNIVETTETELKPLHPDVISLLMSKRPKSASRTEFSNRFVSTNTTQTDTSKEKVSKFHSKHTQVHESEISSGNDKKVTKHTVKTQAPELESIGVQCKRTTPKNASKGCQVAFKPNNESHSSSPKENEPTSTHNFHSLRTTSAHGSRREVNDENLKIERCKSALAIMITRTRVSSSQGKRLAKIQSESTEIDVETSSSISVEVRSQDNQRTEQHQRLFTRRYPVRSITSSRPRTSHLLDSKRIHVQPPIISATKLAKLRKAYGRKNVNMSGLNVKKLRLPMHCGYRCMSANDVSDIVNRLSNLSCRKIHECCRGDRDGASNPPRCRTSTLHHRSELLGKNLYEIDQLTRKSIEEQQKLRCNRIRSAPGKQSDRLLENLENVLTKSLYQLDHSLLQAKDVIASLSGLIERVSPEPRMDDGRTIRSAALYSKPRSRPFESRRCKSQRGPRKTTIESTCMCTQEKVNSRSVKLKPTNFPAIRTRSGKVLKH